MRTAAMRLAASALALVPALYFVFVAAEFAAMTHLALAATADGRSAFAVGLLASVMWLGILGGSVAAHRAIARFGHARVLIAAAALATLAVLSMALHGRYAGWLAAARVLGLGGGLIWVAGEAWLAEAAPPGRRGLYVGWFEASVGLGMMAGPALLPLSAALGVPVLGVAATMMGLATATAWRLRGAAAPSSPHLEGDAPPAWQGMAAPLIAIAVLSGLMETGITALLPSISMRLGATEIAAAWLGAFTGAGSALMQPPAGHLADRIGARRAALLAWAGVAAAAALLLATAADPGRVLHVAGFVFAGAGGAVYTIVIVELGQRLGGAALVKAIAALVIGYAAGTAAGPALGGAVFDAAGLPALAWMLLALAGAGFSLAFAALRRASPPPG